MLLFSPHLPAQWLTAWFQWGSRCKNVYVPLLQSLDHLLDGADGKKRRKGKGGGGEDGDKTLSRSESAPTPRTNTA